MRGLPLLVQGSEPRERPRGLPCCHHWRRRLAAPGWCAKWYDARTACREEMNERLPRSEPPEIRGAYVEQCMKDRGFPNW